MDDIVKYIGGVIGFVLVVWSIKSIFLYEVEKQLKEVNDNLYGLQSELEGINRLLMKINDKS
jgi:uncharacterized protein YoxC